MAEDLDMEDADAWEEEERRQEEDDLAAAEAMELGYGLTLAEENARDEEAEQLVTKLQSLFDHFQVPMDFQRELYSLLRLEDRALFKPITDMALASAVAEIKTHLTFHLSKVFLLFRRIRGSSRAKIFLQSLALLDRSPSSSAATLDQSRPTPPPPPPLHYHSLARATIAAPCSRLYLKLDPSSDGDGDGDGLSQWKDLVFQELLGDRLRDTMIQVLLFDARSKSQDTAWAINLGDGLLFLAEIAVFQDRAGELGMLMRREVGDPREIGVRHHRDRLAHVFEYSRLPVGEKDFFEAKLAPPSRSIASDSSYVIYKRMIQQVERARDDPRCYRCYRNHQRALYDYCVDRIKELHAPLLEEFEQSKAAVAPL